MNKFSILTIYLLILTMVIITGGCKNETETDPNLYISKNEQETFKFDVIKYAGKLAPKATEASKFDKAFDIYYKNLASNHDLVAFFPDETTGMTYFMLSRIAPSLYVKKIAIGGRLKYDQNGNISFYEEGFRTYKMEPEILEKKAMELFQQYMRGKSLEKYLFSNSRPEEWIEFPDENTRYDTSQRKWVSVIKDPWGEKNR